MVITRASFSKALTGGKMVHARKKSKLDRNEKLRMQNKGYADSLGAARSTDVEFVRKAKEDRLGSPRSGDFGFIQRAKDYDFIRKAKKK